MDRLEQLLDAQAGTLTEAEEVELELLLRAEARRCNIVPADYTSPA